MLQWTYILTGLKNTTVYLGFLIFCMLRMVIPQPELNPYFSEVWRHIHWIPTGSPSVDIINTLKKGWAKLMAAPHVAKKHFPILRNHQNLVYFHFYLCRGGGMKNLCWD